MHIMSQSGRIVINTEYADHYSIRRDAGDEWRMKKTLYQTPSEPRRNCGKGPLLAAGLSYGQWKALQPQKASAVRYPLRGQEKRLYCVICGQEIVKGSNNRKYCGPECSEKARYQQKKRLNCGRALPCSAVCVVVPDAGTMPEPVIYIGGEV